MKKLFYLSFMMLVLMSTSIMAGKTIIALSSSGSLSSETYTNGDTLIVTGDINYNDLDKMSEWCYLNTLKVIDISGTNVVAVGEYLANELPEDMFNASNLTSISLPSTLTSIASGAFSGCSKLTSATLPSGLLTIGNDAFYNCTSLTAITIPNSVTSIGQFAFFANKLTSIILPNSITSIGIQAFQNCTGLTSVTLSSVLTKLESGLFSGCSGLVSITLPSSLSSISNAAFFGCSSLATINSENTTPPTLGTNALTGLPSTAVTNCPTGTATAYTTAGYPNAIAQVATNVEEGLSNEKAGIKAYPNPATDKITVVVADETDLTLTNQIGQVVLTDIVSGTKTIDVSSLPRGLYFLKVGKETQKIVLK